MSTHVCWEASGARQTPENTEGGEPSRRDEAQRNLYQPQAKN